MKKEKSLLLSWIGFADLQAFRGQGLEELGPVQNLLAHRSFTHVHLLSDHEIKESRAFVRTLGTNVRLHSVTVDDPTSYLELFAIVDAQLKSLTTQAKYKGYELYIHLSSGTRLMTAIWFLLGKSRYPARFLQTYKKVDQKEKGVPPWREETVPYDLAIDFVHEVLEKPDRHLEHLASKSPSEIEGFKSIVGDSAKLRVAVGRAQRAALRSVPVLLRGESGTGKEVFARAMYACSPRRSKPFVALNCAAIPKDLLEAELFGYVKGAFSGADRDNKGAFEQAHGGTLFLDEVGECDTAMQAKILRVLQPPPGASPSTRVFRRVGGKKDIKVDVRILSATNRDLVKEVRANRFREDLYYRLAVITVKLPALRERKGDIPALAKAFLAEINRDFSKEDMAYTPRRLSKRAELLIKRYEWPGNVRQLYNALLQAAVMSADNVIQEADLRDSLEDVSGEIEGVLDRPLGEGFNIDDLLSEVRKHYLLRAMEEAKGVKTKATKLLGMNHWQTLDQQLKKLEINFSKR